MISSSRESIGWSEVETSTCRGVWISSKGSIASYLAGGGVLCDLVDDGARVEVALVHVADHEHNIAVVVNQLVC